MCSSISAFLLHNKIFNLCMMSCTQLFYKILSLCYLICTKHRFIFDYCFEEFRYWLYLLIYFFIEVNNFVSRSCFILYELILLLLSYLLFFYYVTSRNRCTICAICTVVYWLLKKNHNFGSKKEKTTLNIL